MKFETLAIHAGQGPDPAYGAVMTPIYQVSTFAFADYDKPGMYDYTRSGNPTRKALEVCLAALENGTHSALIGSPGNAASAITVGSYDFRATWQTKNNQTTRYNIVPGSLSNYSSPGYRRDGFIKPDVSAPGRYAISPLAPGSEMGEGALKSAAMTTADGKHFAWQGTSAATPYVTGVIALMLQKNPRLDAAQILDILHRSAKADPFTGAVPNRQWGYGKINPEAALAATPAVSKK